MSVNITRRKPYGSHVLLRRLPTEKTIKGGLILTTEIHSEENIFCELLAKGHGEWKENGTLKPSTLAEIGDIVVCRQFESKGPGKVPTYQIPDELRSGQEYFVCQGDVVEGILRKGVSWEKKPSSESLECLLDYCVIERDPEEQKIRGFWIPELSQEPKAIGTVIAMGPGFYDGKGNYHATELKPGDRVMFSQWCGYDAYFDGVKYMMCRQFDLYGSVEQVV